MFYCPSASGTIISPDHVCAQADNNFTQFVVHSDVATGRGSIHFLDGDAIDKACVDLHRSNGLWYISDDDVFPTVSNPTTTKMNAHQTSELWSLRLGSPGSRQLAQIPRHTSGLPQKLHLHQFRVLDDVVDANMKKENAGSTDRDAT